MPAVEEFGVEPIPAELRTVGWRDHAEHSTTNATNAASRSFDTPERAVQGMRTARAAG
jgi:hypothetical protein